MAVPQGVAFFVVSAGNKQWPYLTSNPAKTAQHQGHPIRTGVLYVSDARRNAGNINSYAHVTAVYQGPGTPSLEKPFLRIALVQGGRLFTRFVRGLLDVMDDRDCAPIISYCSPEFLKSRSHQAVLFLCLGSID